MELPSGSAADYSGCERWKYFQLLSFLDYTASTRLFTLTGSEDLPASPATGSKENYSTPCFTGTNSTSMERPRKSVALDGQQAAQHTANSTSQLLESLAGRISRSNLTEDELEEIESGIAAYVFGKLKDFKNKRAEQ